MAGDIYTFKRIEKKYRIDSVKKELLINEISDHLIPDPHGKSTICSLYLDTPDFLIIRNSINAKIYKEKLRLRCYGTPGYDDKVFLEIKKKYKGVVYKRRISTTLSNACAYLNGGSKPEDSQIMSEIDYAMDFYKMPQPKTLIAYEREAYFIKDLPNLRITFDYNVRYRTNDLHLENGSDGKSILGKNEFILEIKTDGTTPLWLSHALDKCGIFPTSFSKYGTAYREFSTDRFSNNINGHIGEPEYATV